MKTTKKLMFSMHLPWEALGTHGKPWEAMKSTHFLFFNVFLYCRASQGFPRLPRTSQDFPGLPNLCNNFPKTCVWHCLQVLYPNNDVLCFFVFPRISYFFCFFLQNMEYLFQGFPGLSKTSQEFLGLPKTSQDFPGLPKTSQDFPRLPRTSQGFPGLPRTSQDFPRFHVFQLFFPRLPKNSQGFPGLPRASQRLRIVKFANYNFPTNLTNAKLPNIDKSISTKSLKLAHFHKQRCSL